MKQIWKEFRDFAMKGSVVDLAVGVIIGTAFNQIVNSLVKDVVMPPIAFVTRRIDFTNMYISLTGGNYPTLQDAQKAGEITINYGNFINTLISFLLTAVIIFIVIKQMNRFRRKEEKQVDPDTKYCSFCFKEIPEKAVRCAFCTSTL